MYEQEKIRSESAELGVLAGRAECSVESRDDRHITIHYAIKEMDQLIRHADNIYSRITSGAKPVDNDVKEPPTMPSLTDLLECGADEIRKRCEVIHQKLESIENALF